MFFTERIVTRITKGTRKMVEDLLTRFPDEFTNESDIVRTGIIKLYRAKGGKSVIDFK